MTFSDLVGVIIAQVLDPLIFLVGGLALLYFIWGVGKYILHGGDADQRTEGYQMMVYGIIALFVMVSVWGLVEILQNTFLRDLGGSGSMRSINIKVNF